MLLSLFSLAMGNSVTAPAKISENDLLYFRVALDSSDAFDITKVYVDNSLIVSVVSDGVTNEHDRKVIDAFTIDSEINSPSGLTLYVVYIGLNVGNHDIVSKAYQGGEVREDSVTVEVFEGLPADFKQTTESQMTSLESTTSTLQGTVDEQASQITQTQSQLSALEQTVNSTSSELQSFKSETEQELNTLDASLEELDQENESLSGQISLVEEEVEKKIDNPLTGFAAGAGETAGGSNIFLPLFILIGVVIAVFLFLNRDRFIGRASTLYSREERVEGEEDLSAEERKEVEEAVEERKKGKWAFQGGDDDAFNKLKRKEKEQEKKFKFRDLLKKN